VAIYVGGRTGPDAVRGSQILDIVPCDKALPDVVAKVIDNLGQHAESPFAAARPFTEASTPQALPMPAAPEPSHPLE